VLASSIPSKFQVPFASAAGSGYIRPIPLATPASPGGATLLAGFNPSSFVPTASGGNPPFGEEFNGLLFQSTSWDQWYSAGGPIAWDAAFSAAVGGYPNGAVVASAATTGLFWYSTADNNTTNPDAGGANWVSFTPINLFAVDTGAPNAYVFNFIPSGLTAPLVGKPVYVQIGVGNTNTGASIANGKPFVNQDGSSLVGGQVKAGGIYCIVYDGMRYQLQQTNASGASSGGGVIAVGPGLTGNAAGGTQLAYWTVPQLVAGTSLGGPTYAGNTLSLSFNGATVGVNAMDQSGTFPTSGALYVYAIYNPTTNTWATLGTVACNGPTYTGAFMPTGFVASVKLWSGITTGTPNIHGFQQIGNTIYYKNPQNVLSAFPVADNTWATLSLASCVPPDASSVFGQVGSLTNTVMDLALASDTMGSFVQWMLGPTGSNNAFGPYINTGMSFTDIPLTTPQQIAWQCPNTSYKNSIDVRGYRI
jgi:hypothetical protein